MDKSPGHVSERMMQRFFRLELSRRDTAWLVRHLLSRCPQCLEVALQVGQYEGFIPTGKGEFQSASASHDPASYAEVFLGLLRGGEGDVMRLARERLQGMGLLAELEKHPLKQRLSLVRDDPRFHHWGLFDRMLVKYLDYSRNDPQAGIDLVYLALGVLETLPQDRYKKELIEDFRASAFSALGNAKRLGGFFEEAKAAIQAAWESLEDGTGDPLEEANLLSLEATLHRDLGQFDRSAALLDRAIRIYKEIGDDNRYARILIQQADAFGHAEPAKGIELLQDALSLLDAAQEPRLELCARHNLAWFLNDAGQSNEALAFLEMTRPLYCVFTDSWTQLRLHWLEARIARSLGDLIESEAIFQKVAAEFEKRDIHHELTLVSIDLAETYSTQGKLDAAVKLAADFQPVLASWGMHAEGQAMWMLFHKSLAEHAAMKATVETAAFRGIAHYFHHAWHRPMRFESTKPS